MEQLSLLMCLIVFIGIIKFLKSAITYAGELDEKNSGKSEGMVVTDFDVKINKK